MRGGGKGRPTYSSGLIRAEKKKKKFIRGDSNEQDMPDSRFQKKALKRQPVGKPRQRCQDNVTRVSKKLSAVTKVAIDRSQRQRLTEETKARIGLLQHVTLLVGVGKKYFVLKLHMSFNPILTKN